MSSPKNASASKCAFAKGPVSNSDIVFYKEVSMNDISYTEFKISLFLIGIKSPFRNMSKKCIRINASELM